MTASAFKLGETEANATFAASASCGNAQSTSADNGVYTFAAGTTGTLTFTVTANEVTYTVTAEITSLTSEASTLPATVTAPSGSESSGS
ncbi:MAG: hypothetical protein K2N87_04265 [Eubacterium sp.]|nr:hypothetical protein [Eubacterium sp.]